MHSLKAYILFLSLTIFSGYVSAQKVLVMEIDDQIDPRMNRYTELALDKANEDSVDAVIIDMNTYGGAVNDADEIRTRFLDYEKPLYVFINKNAASAGALISIACDSIYMAQGSSIGAATVVNQTGEAAPDKYQSYMRSMMRSTAEASGRNPEIAEGMVDENIEIDSITESGEVITFSTSEAIKYGFCEAEVEDIDEILKRVGLENAEIIRFELSGTEKIIRFFLNPFISGILILIIIGGIYFELQTPGVGFPLAASIVALTLYFVPYYLNGMAENWELIMFIIGIGLIILEFFVIPGFGIAGISGIILALGALVLIMLNNDLFDFQFVGVEKVVIAIATTLAGFTGSVILAFIGGVRLTQSKFFDKIALVSTQQRSEGYTSRFIKESMIGVKGTTFTVLRPSGKILINGKIFDAYTRGEYIGKDKKVEIIDESGTSFKVREITDNE